MFNLSTGFPLSSAVFLTSALLPLLVHVFLVLHRRCLFHVVHPGSSFFTLADLLFSRESAQIFSFWLKLFWSESAGVRLAQPIGFWWGMGRAPSMTLNCSHVRVISCLLIRHWVAFCKKTRSFNKAVCFTARSRLCRTGKTH